jgi:hypothetical protein
MKKLIVLVLALLMSAPAFCRECPDIKGVAGKRPIVVISDLHFGQGKTAAGWLPTEDFRWSNALGGFLSRLNTCLGDSVDLVVAGDFLELWQPPPDVSCNGADRDTGCTENEVLAIIAGIVKQHKTDLEAFGTFADARNNRVFFVPGNHDAAIILPSVWAPISNAIHSQKGRVIRCGIGSAKPCTKNGWVSENGAIFVEHGHQIGEDVNKFSAWPNITVDKDQVSYVERPWGQLFVQKLFNEQEQAYPVIDNLMPESAGVRLRLADRGLWRSAADMARFLHFNVFETSAAQRSVSLGEDGAEHRTWDTAAAKTMRYRLYTESLPANDEFRVLVESDNPFARDARAALDGKAANLSDKEIAALCEKMAINSRIACDGGSLGATRQTLFSKENKVYAEHLQTRKASEAPNLAIFIFAHTHEFIDRGDVELADKTKVQIRNTGAFQRLVSDVQFRKIAAAKSLKPSVALSKLTVDDLLPCYTAVFAIDNGAASAVQTIRWRMAENAAKGDIVGTTDAACD